MNYGPGPASRKPARSEVIASSILLCVLVGVGTDVLVTVMAELYEEAGARAALQLRLQHVIGPVSAEVLAGIVFVVLHGFVIAKSPWQVPFLALSAFANGRLAAVTQTVGYPVLSHGLSNGILMVTYIIFRGMNR